MAKKNNKRKRKRKPLKANPKRQAHAQLRGYLYQIWHSVNAWLDLTDDEVLYLEGAEDFDRVSDNAATAAQVKHTQRNITLRSQDVIDAINNFWELQADNPDRRVKFRFLTRSKIGVEQDNLFGKGVAGLEVWSRCLGDEAVITKISEFLQTEEKISREVNDFLKVSSPQDIYEQLIEPITWETESKSASYVERSINDKVFLVGNQYSIPIPPHDTQKVVDSLLTKALTVATQKENRELTQMHFLKIFYEKAMQNVLNWYPQHLQMLEKQTTVLDTANAAFIRRTSDVTIQSQSPIQDTIPELYPNVIQRTGPLTDIQTKLQSNSITIIHGGTGKGKTTLAKLTANAMDGNWFWLNFTNKNPSLVVLILQQLAIAVSNESGQVSVVLDDLNLQPQQLREYEEDLGVVTYRVLERGAKLLITSQYKPPNNFIRILGLSPSVVVNAPNFNTSEIEQFAEQLGCPAEQAKTWSELVQVPTSGHPRLVHALLTHLREKDWNREDVIESILQTPQEVVEEREAARQLLMDLPEDSREFLYRLSLMSTMFRKDYVLNIGEIPKPIPYPGDVFSQLVGPWIDRVSENYYTISALLKDAAKEVWSESKIKDLHAHIGDAILETKDLTTTEAWAVLLHSMRGENRKGLIAVIRALIAASQDNWKIVSKEFSFLIPMKIDLPEKLFIGDAFVKYLIRFLQYRIAARVKPKFARKILEVWDKETKAQQQSQEYQLLRRMLTMEALRYNQVLLPAKQMVDYLQEVIEITNSDEDVQDVHGNFMEQLGEHKTDKSSIFSILFSFVYTRPPIYAPFLSDLIDALDELQPENRTLLLADFEDENIESRLLIDGVWWAEANREKPDWSRCLEVFDKVIEKVIAWGYPHIAAASARGKAIIHDEYLSDTNTAHEVLQDIISKLEVLPVIEEAQAVVYFNQKRYTEALNIYERILHKWNPPSEQLNLGPLEEYRRAAICAASLGDWGKAATFFEEGAKKTQKIENNERYIGLYADAGFAQFKAGNMLDGIKLLDLTLRKFEMLPQDNTALKYFTLKKRLGHTIGWLEWHENGNYDLEFEEPPIGFCSNPETDERFLDLPDSPIEHAWLNLAKIEYKFENRTKVLEHALQVIDRDIDPISSFLLSVLEVQHDFRNKTVDDLPQRIHQLVKARHSIQKHSRSEKGIGVEGIDSFPIADLPDLASIGNITAILVSALLTQLPTTKDISEILTLWRANSSELPIKENMNSTLDMMELILLGEQGPALTAMKTQEEKSEKRLISALRVVQDKETSPEDLFHAQTLIATSLIDQTWLDPVVRYLAELLSAQWLKKIKFRATLKTPMLTVPQIERACNSSETDKKKIGQILLAVLQAISIKVTPEVLQQFRSWAESESEQKREPIAGKNPIAQRLIEAMEKPPHLTDEDVEALHQSIKEGKTPIKFDSPFELDKHEKE